MGSKTVTLSDTKRIAKLANLPLSSKQEEVLTKQIGVTVDYISQLASLPTKNEPETSQVAGLENVYRDDEIESSRILTQEEALANSKRTHNGFFVVDLVLGE